MAACHVGLNATNHLLCYAMEIILLLHMITCVNSLSFHHQGFDYEDVRIKGDATLSHSKIELTSTTRYQSNAYSVGRVTSFEPLHLWDMRSSELADFTTEFSFIIFSNETSFGDGFAFFFADPKLPLLSKIKEGGGLGLVDGDQTLKSTKHPFVAVEFDTHQNTWDPPGTHVGININSMMSSINAPWYVDIRQMKVYYCGIEYNGSSHNLNVSFTGYIDGKTVKDYISYTVDLRDYLPEWVIFGFSAATGIMFEMNTLLSWSFDSSLQSNENVPNDIPPMAASPIPNLHPSPVPNPNSLPIPSADISPKQDNQRGFFMRLGVGVGIAASFLILGLVCSLMWKRAKGKKKDSLYDLNMDDEFQKGIGPKRFCYKTLASATNNFAEAQKIGQGGFGGVYKGYLKYDNSFVAIKKISRESRQGIKEYATEVKIISQLRHRNLVQLIGWCHRKKDFLLIYEFMQNGSLDSHLYHGKSILTWQMRYDIAMDLALAVLYLHEEWEQCVLHRDIKSSNIMLDSSFNAKLGDFGLARLVDHEKGAQTTILAGTRGYIAPEYFTTGKAKKESDIYSFGVVLLELASGIKPVDLKAKEGQITIFEWVWELYRLEQFFDAADPKLGGAFQEEQLERLLVVGLWCANPDYTSRPSIRQVIQVLKFEAPLPVLPQKMPEPYYHSPTMSTVFASVSSPYPDTY
ncbi:L-type lectin-domain containing receptor kinase IX.1-like [Abrus precatorius]|uniref:non-specific serine/threonine protein kinase n=1 Tax=Abrus precatorius TaxID=3816 RepID=A0A8B8K4U3_ABRPR|nr:L-type lectin-domain containing receptor kinase IX.1-like [Abrus precatorius]